MKDVRSENGRKNRGLSRILRTAALIAAVAMTAIPGFAQSPGNAASTKSAGSASGLQHPVSGGELFHQHCASCHYAQANAQKIGPGLKGLYARAFSNGKKVTDASLARWIEAGGKDMPGFQESIKPEQVRALISYIKTL